MMVLIILSSESLLKELKKKSLKKPQSKEFNVYLVSEIEQGSNHFHFENFLMILTSLSHEKILLEMAKN